MKLWTLPTIHPAAIARDQTLIPVVINDLNKPLAHPPEHYKLYPSVDDLAEYEDAAELAVDLETDVRTNQIKIVGLSRKPFYAIAVPFHGEYIGRLRRIFASAKILYTHNGLQFDIPLLEANGIKLHPDVFVFDTMLAHHLCFPQFSGESGKDEDAGRKTAGGHGLEFVSSQFTTKPPWKADALGEPWYWELRCCRDTDITLQIATQLRPMLRQYGLSELYADVQVPLAKICKLMSDTGIQVDPSRISLVREALRARMREEEAHLPLELQTREVPIQRRVPAAPGELSEKTGKPIRFKLVPGVKQVTPWRSDKSVGNFLYETLRLPVQKHVKSEKRTTDKVALDRLYNRTKNRAILAVQRLRSFDETMTTFATEEMRGTSRIHSNFKVHGTASGRLSSSEPNLQNVPKSARVIYVPSQPGWVIVDADFSQIENRLTAYFARDTDRLSRFQLDPAFNEHKWVASVMFGLPLEEITTDNSKDAPYGKAKRITHATNYGMGPRKISMTYDMDFAEVKRLQTKLKLAWHKTVAWQNQTAEQAKKQGYLSTPFRRRRPFYTTRLYTESLSFLPQSTAADILFRAMIGLMYQRIGWPEERVAKICAVWEPLPEPARLLLSVHDSLVFECPREKLDETVSVIQRVMGQPWRELGGFVIPVSVSWGPSWGELQPYVP